MWRAAMWLYEHILRPVVGWFIDAIVKVVTFAVISPAGAMVLGLGIIGVAWLVDLIALGGFEHTLSGLLYATGTGIFFAGVGSLLAGHLAEEVGIGWVSQQTFAGVGAAVGFAGAWLFQRRAQESGLAFLSFLA
jgi:hypothetical protein